MHTRPVVVLALSAATGAGLMLARSHQRRARNGTATDTPATAQPTAAPPAPSGTATVGDAAQPELFRIEARTVSVPRKDGQPNKSAPTPAGAPASVPAVELPPERISSATLVAVAAALAACAVGLAAWAYVARDDTTAPAASGSVATDAKAISVLSSASARRIPFAHSVGRIALVVEGGGRAVLVLNGLGGAPAGKAYQAWVIRNGARTPRAAALFTGGERVVALARPVLPGSTVAVTVERAGGVAAPSHAPTLVARRV